MIKKLTFLLCFFTSVIFSQDLEFTIVVKDFDTDMPIEEVTITSLRTRQGFLTNEDGKVFIYYASSDTRMHVATTTVDRLLDYVMNTPADGYRSAETVKTLVDLIDKNQAEILVRSSYSKKD